MYTWKHLYDLCVLIRETLYLLNTTHMGDFNFTKVIFDHSIFTFTDFWLLFFSIFLQSCSSHHISFVRKKKYSYGQVKSKQPN